METELTDQELTLRPYTLADAEYHLTHEDEEIEKWLSGGKSTKESVEKWILRNADHWKNGGPIFNFAVVDNGVLVGMVEANSDREAIRELEEGDVNISYAIFPEARGHGYASRAVTLLMKFLKHKGFKRAIIRVEPENTASMGVPLKLGFTHLRDPDGKEWKFVEYGKEL